MKFRKVDLLFVGFALLVIVGVSMLPSPKDRNPKVPGTSEHRGLAVERECLRCHVTEGPRPLSARHPKRQDCFRCHQVTKAM